VSPADSPAVPALAAATNRATRSAADSLAATLVVEAAGSRAADASVRDATEAVAMLEGGLGLHDEVLESRPGSENGGRGPVAAGLGGAWLLGSAGEAMAGLGDDAAAIWGEAANALVRARMLAIEDLYDSGRSPARYLRVAEMRSGGLLSLAARLGASLAGAAGPKIAALDEYGRALGIAAEIRADVVGVGGADGPVARRIARGDYPLPLLYATHSDPGLASLLGKPLDAEALVPVLDRVRAPGGLDRAVADCRSRALAAQAALEGLAGVEALREIAERVTPDAVGASR
jgi:geranylgeranyl pyrophosphate synthase